MTHEDVKARHADIEQDGLFDEPPRVTKPRKKSVRRAGVGTCPTCGHDDIGQVRDTGGKIVWRVHHRHTIAGRPIMCSASGRSVGE